MDTEKDLPFTNPNLGAYLAAKKIPLRLEPYGSFVLIIAPKNDEVYQLMDEFNKNGSVSVLDFVNELQILKQKIYAMRGPK